ncbi:MAG: oligosaccharide repeat unit polymerase [Nitrospira sp.]|nr:oligosaccharide repeat unit polymerase [Nitrospira sp.]
MILPNQTEERALLPSGAIGWYLVFLVLLVLFQILWREAISAKDFDLLNVVVPVSFGMANLLLAWKLARTSHMATWNPLFWLLLVCTLYYGVGQLAHPLAHPHTVGRINALYFVDSPGLARTNLLNTAGTAIVVMAYLATWLMVKPRKGRADSGVVIEERDQRGIKEAKWAVWIFLVMGIPIKYFLQLPYDLRLLDWVVPGSIKHVGMLSGVALVPLYWLYKKRGGIYRPLFFLLLVSELLAALVMLSKLEMIKTMLFVVLASQLLKPGIKKLVLSGMAIIIVYALVLSPFVNFSRAMIGRAAATDLSQATNLVEQYKKSGPVQDPVYPHSQSWWVRLAYYNAELFAMREYDRGHPGTTIWRAPYTLIPRFILPDKPIMTAGFEFNYLIRGHTKIDSSHGAGVIGEGYWHGGWFGVIAVGTVVGLLLASAYRFSIHVVEERLFIFLPITLSGILWGLRIDTWFVPTYIGGAIQMMLWYLIINYVVRPTFQSFSRAGQGQNQDQYEGKRAIEQTPLQQAETRQRFPILFGKP